MALVSRPSRGLEPEPALSDTDGSMANSVRRCTNCRDYFPAELIRRAALGGTCSPKCYEELRSKARAKRQRRAVNLERARKDRRESLPSDKRRRVRRRDGDKCRYCGTAFGLQVHHIEYRSQGGDDQLHNLITLCAEHHALVHSNKRKWQPLCRAYVWSYYIEGRRMTLLQLERATSTWSKEQVARVG